MRRVALIFTTMAFCAFALLASTAGATTGTLGSATNPIPVTPTVAADGTYTITLAKPAVKGAAIKGAAATANVTTCQLYPQNPGYATVNGYHFVTGALDISCSPLPVYNPSTYGCIRHSSFNRAPWYSDADSCQSVIDYGTYYNYVMNLAHYCPGYNLWYYHSYGQTTVGFQGTYYRIGPVQSYGVAWAC